jgi:hypothetical protein
LKFKKSHVNSNSSKATYKDFLEYLGSSLCNVWLFVFWVLDKLYFCNFLISNLFSTIVSVSDEPRGGLQLLLGHQKHQSPPLGSSLRWKLKCLVTSWSPLNLGLLISLIFENLPQNSNFPFFGKVWENGQSFYSSTKVDI